MRERVPPARAQAAQRPSTAPGGGPRRRPKAEHARGGTINGAHPKTADETQKLARVRAEELGAQHHIVSGKTTEMTVRAGATFVLTDALGDDQELLLTEVRYRSHRDSEQVGGADRTWENEITAMPRAVPYRPLRNTKKPRVSGLVNAVVDGAVKGPYAELDEAGRYHVVFKHDRSGRTDMLASRPVRMMQPHAGAHYGHHFPLRPGTEVLIAFVEGDPDRPIIVGTAPNPVTPSPVAMGNQTQNVMRTGSNNEMVIEDLVGQERIRVHTPHQNTTLQLGSVEEPEEGVLLVTDAHISEASRNTHNIVTRKSTVAAESVSALAGNSAITLAGLEGLTKAAERGMQRGAVDIGEVSEDLAKLSAPPGEQEDEDEQKDEDDAQAALAGPAGGLFSGLGETLTAMAEGAVLQAIRRIAEATDLHLDSSVGRLQGEALGQPLEPFGVLASPQTAAVIGRDKAVVFGDQVAAVAAEDSAYVVGGKAAMLKSPGDVEVAAGQEMKLSAVKDADISANTVRMVGGHYPEHEAPPLDEHTSVGIMGRYDIKLVSSEHCILQCAEKNFVATAHTGDMRLAAKQQVRVVGGSITGSAGYIGLSSGGDIEASATADITVDAGADITISAGGDIAITAGGTVTISGASIILKGPTCIEGDLVVTGSVEGG